MGQTDAALLRDDRRSHRGGEVIDDDHHFDGVLVEETVEGGHHLAGDLVETGAIDTEVILGTGHLEVVEERGFQRGVVLTAGIGQQTGGIRPISYRPHQGRHLDEIGPCAREDTDILCHTSINLLQR